MKTPPKIPSKIPAKTDDTQAGHRDRMRAKLLERGSESLSEQELLEMLLFLNYRRQDIKPIVKSLLSILALLVLFVMPRRQNLPAFPILAPAALRFYF